MILGLVIVSVEFTLSITPQKLEKSQSSFQGNMKGTSSISFGTDKCDRTFILNSTGSAFGEKKITLSLTSSNSSSETVVLTRGGEQFPKETTGVW